MTFLIDRFSRREGRLFEGSEGIVSYKGCVETKTSRTFSGELFFQANS